MAYLDNQVSWAVMFCHRRLFSGPPLPVIAAIFFFILFITKQAKDLYELNQRQHRMENYNKFISEVSASMNTLEASANKSSDALHQLIDVLQHHRGRPSSINS